MSPLPDALRRIGRASPSAASISSLFGRPGSRGAAPLRAATTLRTMATFVIVHGAARARDAGWAYREISVGHDPQVLDAEGIARLLAELAAPAPLA